ncbi:MAG: AAA family ATPase [Prevotellamassilia sp.]|nr:AAA family ATPase [Prevotellamassilia sp.]
MKYPVGVQSFEKLRNEGYVYVDKTALVYKLVQEGSSYFLSRPRRFGKSILLTTIEAYFKGQKHLFEDLALADLETEWKEYPVLHLDLNAERYETIGELENILDAYLREWEEMYDSTEGGNSSLSIRFRSVIRAAKKKTGKNVVVLIDEYDKPILQAIGNEALQDEFRNALKAFYGVLKSADADLRFTLLTGVTKFGKVSVFSDLNNLNDITMDARYATLCGITETELKTIFNEGVEALASKNNQTKEETYDALRHRYDGYHFAVDTPGLYNPFSVLNTLEKSTYSDYWFSTGTPTYLVELLKKTNFKLGELSNLKVSFDGLDNIHRADINPIAVLFQSGYLTIKGYDNRFRLYKLDYPNEEVRQGFVNFLLPYYTEVRNEQSQTYVTEFVIALEEGDANRFLQLMQVLMADTPYELIRELENHYQNVMYIITKLMGFYIQAEYRTSRGRIDLLIGTDKYVYIIELKFDGSAEEALAQIDAKDYALPFAVGGRQVIKIGANIGRESRNIDTWVVAE